MRIAYSREAELDLDGVWTWNAERYGIAHADSYRTFLVEQIARLKKDHGLGRPIGESKLKYVTIRKGPARHGHLAVYRVSYERIDVIRVFHTAQNWQKKLEDD